VVVLLDNRDKVLKLPQFHNRTNDATHCSGTVAEPHADVVVVPNAELE
jgi:hypothetical protein